MRTKFNTYRIEYPSGEIDDVRVPTFFGPKDVYRKLSAHCVVELVLHRRECCIVENVSGLVHGPAILTVSENGTLTRKENR